MPQNRKTLRWAALIILLVIITAAAVFRIMLPGMVLKYVNETLGQMEDYRGRIGNIRIHLWRGAYEIIDINLEKTSGKVPVPFISIPRMELSVEWSEVIHGALVGEMTIYEPKLNFVKGPTKETSQATITPSWMDITKKLFPFSINRLDIVNGSVHFRDFHSNPKINVYLDRLYADASNLTNSRSVSENRFARITMHNKPGKGDPAIKVFVNLNTFAEEPTFDMRFSLNSLDLNRLNDFFKAYGNFDVESGTFSLYSEMKASEGSYKGYVKPLFKNLNVVDWKTDKKSLLRLTWEAIVGAAAKILENEPSGRVATIIPVEGNFKNKDIDYWSAIGSLLKNAFIEAIKPKFEGITTGRSKAKE